MATQTQEKGTSQQVRRRFLTISAAALLPASLLAGCGGGDESDPPSISLYSTVTSANEGETFSLSAEADDDDGIEKVEIIRVRNNSEELLITFYSKPFLYTSTIPTGAKGTDIKYKARVTDTDDQSVDSNTVSIYVNT